MPNRLNPTQFQGIFDNIDTCNRLFPKAFPKKGAEKVMPLKVGIAGELRTALADAGHEISMKAVRRLLTYWCSRNFYLKSFKRADFRIDLAGNPAGEVTDQQRVIAKEELGGRAKRREAKQEAKLEAAELVAQQAL